MIPSEVPPTTSSASAARTAVLASITAGVLWTVAWAHLLLTHGSGSINEQRLAFGFTWLDSGRLVAPSLGLGALAVWSIVGRRGPAAPRAAGAVAVAGLVVAAFGSALGFWLQPVGTYIGASREIGVAAAGGMLAFVGSFVAAIGLVLVAATAARSRLVRQSAAAVVTIIGLALVPWLHESTWSLVVGLGWLALGVLLASGRDAPWERSLAGSTETLTRRVAAWRPARAGRLAGALAVASGVAHIAYLVLAPDVRDSAVTTWNLLIIPAALWLGWLAARFRRSIAALATAAGVGASLLWAFGYARPDVEPWWIGLAAAWWLGLAVVLLQIRRRLGWFTLALGVAAAVDFVLTVLDAPMPIYALGGFKIPMTSLWSLWAGVALLRDPMLRRRTPAATPRPRVAGGNR
jgi:hypothetical protein